MAFKYQISASQDKRCNELNIYDETGTGIDGWGDGTTNPDISGVTECLAKITFSNGAVWNGSILSTSPAFPSTNNTIPYVFTSVQLNDKIQDGKFTIETRVVGQHTHDNGNNGVLGLYTFTGFLFCNVECCVRKMRTKIDPLAMHCENTPEWKNAKKAMLLLASLKNAVECKKFDKATVILAALKELCATNHCNCQ